MTRTLDDLNWAPGGARDPLSILKRVYGYPAFRGSQAEVVATVVSGGDAVVLFPTGAGKSLCYQIPAICRDGVGIVISPLIALMRDQVEALKQLGVPAAALNSSLSGDEYSAVRRALSKGELELLYVTPERAATPGFAEMMRGVKIALFAIDEAHCVSQWGHDFRPDIAISASSRSFIPACRAWRSRRLPIRIRAKTSSSGWLWDEHTSSPRPSTVRISPMKLSSATSRASSCCAFSPATRARAASSIACRAPRSKTRRSGSIRKDQCACYHAGMDRAVRDANQDAFLKEEGLCLVATVAFGMGIDKPNVRYVAHLDLPVRWRPIIRRRGARGVTACRRKSGWPMAWPMSSSAGG